MASLVGSRVERKEDKRFLTGKGKYTADINIANQTYAIFVRSPHARAKIKKLDISKALKSSGVVSVLTGSEIAEDKIGGLIAGWAIRSEDGTEMKCPANPPLAKDNVNFVGDPIAIVIAESLAEAKSAAEKVQVDYKILKAVTSTADAMDDETIHEGIDKNLCFDWLLGDRLKVKEAFDKADKVISIDIINNRLIPNAMEPRACIADYNTASEEITLYTTSQNPHLSRLIMSAFGNVAPEHKLRVIAPDVGGGFGSKINVYNEDIVCSWAAKKINRAIKWVAERSESFLTDIHGRDHVTHAELAVTNDGKFLGFKNETIANLGAYARVFATVTPTYLFGPCATGVYEIPAAYSNVKAVFTNTAPVDAYRGAGRPEATYTIERLVEKASMELGIDKTELRMKNFIPKEAFPYHSPTGWEYDSGDYHAALQLAMDNIGYDDLLKEQKEKRENGELMGIGICSFTEVVGAGPSKDFDILGIKMFDSSEIRIHPTGKAIARFGTKSQGQGHETTYAQIIAEELGIPFTDVSVEEGDTDTAPYGLGTYASRSTPTAGAAAAMACRKIKAKAKKIAAHLLETSEDDLDWEVGKFSVKGVPEKSVTIQDIAFAAYTNHPQGLEAGLEATHYYDPPNLTFPFGYVLGVVLP